MFAIGLVGALLALQTPAAQVTFEVASIKENREPGAAGGLRRAPDGSLRAERFRARFLLTIAYRLQPFQLVGVPDWTNDTYYDINAKPAAGSPTSRDQMSDMLQALLVDRFTLAFHREVRATDGFALVPIKRGTLGRDLKVSSVDCDQTPEARPCRQLISTPNTFTISGASMSVLVRELVAAVNAPVADETGLSGTYDFNLRWSADATAADDLPSLFTALQEQLGLKLEADRGPVDVVVIDSVQPPTED